MSLPLDSENRLPAGADLTQLKLRARELQRAFASADAGVREVARAQVARHVPHRSESAALALADAQCTVARSYGFPSWPRLKAHVEWMRKPPEERLEAAATTVNPHGFTDLDGAQYVENLDTLRAMLRQESEIARKRWGKRQQTLLHQAAWGNGLKMTELLLESGADPCARDAGGATPLSVALHFGYGRQPLALRLAALGPSPDNLRVAAGLGQLDRARELLAEAHRPDSQAGVGHEVWHLSYDFAERPLPRGRQALIDDAFSCAARSEQLEVMTWLLDEGANVNAMPYVGTALHWAAFLGREKSVRFLLDHGADVTLQEDMNGGTALHWWHVYGFELEPETPPHVSISELLLEHGVTAEFPLLCAYAPASRVAEALSQPNLDVHERDFHGFTGLMNAVHRGREDVAVMLLERGADPDLSDHGAETPRAVAKRKGLRGALKRMA